LFGFIGNKILFLASLARYDRLRREELEMKKSIAVILLGSALLMSNNNNVEASTIDNGVQVQKDRYIQFVGGEESHFYFNKLITQKQFYIGKDINLDHYFKELMGKIELKPAPVTPKPSEPVEKPAPVIPAPSEPVEKPAPVTPAPSEPVEKPAPVTPAPSEPVEKPAPVTPAPSKPVENPTPVTPAPVTPAPSKPVETPAPVKPAPTQDASVSAVEKAVFDLTNVERQKAGLPAFQMDSKLAESARAKSADMATKNYFSHTSPTYGSPFDQMKSFGVTYKSAGENIAMGQRSAEEVVKGWMESPGHRANILNANFTHLGVGYVKNGNYWTQQFIGK